MHHDRQRSSLIVTTTISSATTIKQWILHPTFTESNSRLGCDQFCTKLSSLPVLRRHRNPKRWSEQAQPTTGSMATHTLRSCLSSRLATHCLPSPAAKQKPDTSTTWACSVLVSTLISSCGCVLLQISFGVHCTGQLHHRCHSVHSGRA